MIGASTKWPPKPGCTLPTFVSGSLLKRVLQVGVQKQDNGRRQNTSHVGRDKNLQASLNVCVCARYSSPTNLVTENYQILTDPLKSCQDEYADRLLGPSVHCCCCAAALCAALKGWH
eukprot:4223673-Amphidinium_carterae.1